MLEIINPVIIFITYCIFIIFGHLVFWIMHDWITVVRITPGVTVPISTAKLKIVHIRWFDIIPLYFNIRISIKPFVGVKSYKYGYHKNASRSRSWLVAHPRIFRLFMKGKFEAYVLWPLGKRVQNWIVAPSTASDFMLYLINIWKNNVNLII